MRFQVVSLSVSAELQEDWLDVISQSSPERPLLLWPVQPACQHVGREGGREGRGRCHIKTVLLPPAASQEDRAGDHSPRGVVRAGLETLTEDWRGLTRAEV